MTHPNADRDAVAATLVGDDNEQIITSSGEPIDPSETSVSITARTGGPLVSRRGGEIFIRNHGDRHEP